LRNVFTYTGAFANNNFDGLGVLEQYGHMKISGRFKDGKLNGFGVITTPNGNGYQGSFVAGQPDGLITFFDHQGQDDYTTFYKNGREIGPRQKVKNSSRKLI
jgi:hypothetical protein